MLDKETVTRTAATGMPAGAPASALCGPSVDGRHGDFTAAAAAIQSPSRVDLLRVLTGLRHLRASTEPGRVFSELAGVCVPALCDEVVITLEEAGGHRYRIRQPAPAPANTPKTSNGVAAHTLSGGTGHPVDPPGPVRVAPDTVRAVVSSVPGGGPAYTATVLCSWRTGYLPTDADVALVGVLAEHAAGVVHRERTMGRLTDQEAARQVGDALDGAQRIAAATGVLMALHHLSVAQARRLLDRASDRTHRSLRQVADTVLRTGALTERRQQDADNLMVDGRTSVE